MTMMEIIVVLAVVGIMAVTLTPMILNYLDDAKLSKAEEDVRTIGSALLTLTKDVKHFPLYTDGTKTSGAPDLELLRGPGNPPLDNSTSGQEWLGTTKVGELNSHLVSNNPGVAKYPTTGRGAWKGPYVERLSEDPWQAKVVWVLSAGPNAKIETDPTALADSGPVPGGDDIVVRVK